MVEGGRWMDNTHPVYVVVAVVINLVEESQYLFFTLSIVTVMGVLVCIGTDNYRH